MQNSNLMGKNFFKEIDKNDVCLFIILILITTSIFLKSIFSSNGYLYSDSTEYLALAQNLIQNGSFDVYTGLTPNKTFFSIWPIGYPVFIYIIAKLSGLSVFWASKILNIIFIMIIMFFLKKIFKRNAYIYATILLFASFLETFSSSLSESPFIVFLMIFCSAAYWVHQEKSPNITTFALLFFSAIFLFLTRYIGIFSFALIALLGLYFLFKHENIKGLKTIALAIASAGVAFAYLFHNYLETGFFTGMPRIPAPESNLFLLKSLLESIVQQFIPYVIRNTKDHVFFLLSYPILLLFFINNRKLIFANNLQDNVLPIIFIIVGLSYFSTLVFLRWVSHFDNFCFRLLAPASFLIFIGVINIVEMTFTKKYFDFIKNFILIVAGFSWVYNVPYQLVADYKTPLFAENIVKLQQEYSGVESDSVVVFAPVDLKFLRTDVILTSPFTQPYASINEKWNDFINRINPDKTKNIYLAKIDAVNLEKYDQTVKDFVNHQSYETIFKVP